MPEITIRIRQWSERSRRRLATAGVGLVACLLAAHILLGSNGMLTYREKRAQHQQLEQEIRSLEAENQRLAERIRDLKTSPQAIEKEAREQLRYARPGEVVFVLPETPAPRPPANAIAEKRP